MSLATDRYHINLGKRIERLRRRIGRIRDKKGNCLKLTILLGRLEHRWHGQLWDSAIFRG